mgnify:CR=1 FL=1
MANPIDIGSKIYKVLEQLFGKAFARNMIGTQANVVKPKAMDSNAPTGNIYSKKMLENNPGSLSLAEEKIREYAPSILANKNVMEQMNFLENAENVLNIKKKETGSIMKDPTKTKTAKEADVVDITTGKKVEGIEQLKAELGLPEEVTPKTKMGKNLQELKRLTKETELQQKDIEETLSKGLEDILKVRNTAKTFMEGRRRPIIRQILAEEDIIQRNLSIEDYDDLLFGMDLDKGADPNKDPFVYLDKYFVRDEDKLDILDDIIDEMPGSTPERISTEFKKRTGGFKPKDPDLGDKLKDLPDDIDPDALAEGGRPGFAGGSRDSLLSPQMQDYINNYSDQMTFEEYLQMTVKRKKSAGGGLNYLMGM